MVIFAARSRSSKGHGFLDAMNPACAAPKSCWSAAIGEFGAAQGTSCLRSTVRTGSPELGQLADPRLGRKHDQPRLALVPRRGQYSRAADTADAVPGPHTAMLLP